MGGHQLRVDPLVIMKADLMEHVVNILRQIRITCLSNKRDKDVICLWRWNQQRMG